jgi:hypothetical protein
MTKGISLRRKRGSRGWSAANKLYIIETIGNTAQSGINASYTPFKNIKPGP